MAGVTFSIGGTNLLELADPGTTGRYALACIPGNAMKDRKRFHVPGSVGNITVDCEDAGIPIVCSIRYIETLANIEANIAADQAAWDVTAGVSIVHQGKTYARCHLVPGGMKKISPVQSTGRGTAFVNVEAPFICDGGVS